MKYEKLLKLWKQLGNIPVTNDDEIDMPFLHFDKGTDKMTIWHWFEEQNPNFSVGKMF